MAFEPDKPARETETGDGVPEQKARAGLRAALARTPGDTHAPLALSMLTPGRIAGLVAFRRPT